MFYDNFFADLEAETKRAQSIIDNYHIERKAEMDLLARNSREWLLEYNEQLSIWPKEEECTD